jgi:hypothetical protein
MMPSDSNRDGKAALMLRIRREIFDENNEETAKPGDRRSFNLDEHSRKGECLSGQPSTPAREGEEEK